VNAIKFDFKNPARSVAAVPATLRSFAICNTKSEVNWEPDVLRLPSHREMRAGRPYFQGDISRLPMKPQEGLW
jgi:hypothetical protein